MYHVYRYTYISANTGFAQFRLFFKCRIFLIYLIYRTYLSTEQHIVQRLIRKTIYMLLQNADIESIGGSVLSSNFAHNHLGFTSKRLTSLTSCPITELTRQWRLLVECGQSRLSMQMVPGMGRFIA